MNTQEKEYLNEDEIALRVANSLSVQDQSSLRLATLFSEEVLTTTSPKSQSSHGAARPNLRILMQDKVDAVEEQTDSVAFGGFSFGVTISEIDQAEISEKKSVRKGTGYLGMNSRQRLS